MASIKICFQKLRTKEWCSNKRSQGKANVEKYHDKIVDIKNVWFAINQCPTTSINLSNQIIIVMSKYNS